MARGVARTERRRAIALMQRTHDMQWKEQTAAYGSSSQPGGWQEEQGAAENPLSRGTSYYSRPLPARPGHAQQLQPPQYSGWDREEPRSHEDWADVPMGMLGAGGYDGFSEGRLSPASRRSAITFEERVKMGDTDAKLSHNLAAVGFLLVAVLVIGAMALGIWVIVNADIKPKKVHIPAFSAPVAFMDSAASTSGR